MQVVVFDAGSGQPVDAGDLPGWAGPAAPHMSADAYDRLTGRRVWEEPWPDADPALLEADVIEIVCQVNGKVRDRVTVGAGDLTQRFDLAHLLVDDEGFVFTRWLRAAR